MIALCQTVHKRQLDTTMAQIGDVCMIDISQIVQTPCLNYKGATCDIVPEAHSTQCNHSEVTRSHIAPALRMMERHSWHQYKQGESNRAYDNGVYKFVQSVILETFHWIRQFFVGIADVHSHKGQED